MNSLKKSEPALKLLLGFGAITAFSILTVPAQAVTANFNLSTPSAENFSTKDYQDSGITLTANGASGVNLPADALNSNSQGFCAFAEVGTSGGRCALISGSDAILSGFSFGFDTPVWLRSFDIAQFTNLSSGTISFQSGANNQTFNLSGNGSQAFTGDFVVSNSVTVTTTGVSLGTNGGVFRLSNLAVEEVPGPLPLLGIGSAFAFSRKLRQKTNSTI
jgi:hypothetical protein